MSKPDRFDEEAEKLVGDICVTDDIAAFGRKLYAEGQASKTAEVEALKEKVGRMEKPHQWMLEEAVKHQERKDLAKRLGVDGSGKCECSMCLVLTPPDKTEVKE